MSSRLALLLTTVSMASRGAKAFRAPAVSVGWRAHAGASRRLASVGATKAPPAAPDATDDAAADVMPSMDDLVSLCKRRGFIFPSSDIYNGFNGFYDYGPLGVELKQNIKQQWWRTYVAGVVVVVVGELGSDITPPRPPPLPVLSPVGRT